MDLKDKNILNLTIEGDFIKNQFSVFALRLEFNELLFTIFLDAQQTQQGLESDDVFEPILELTNLLSDSGIAFKQFISIISNEDSNEKITGEFLNAYHEVLVEPWGSFGIITITDTATDNYSGGNIQLSSQNGNYFEINTESYTESTSILINNISTLLLKTGVDIILK